MEYDQKNAAASGSDGSSTTKISPHSSSNGDKSVSATGVFPRAGDADIMPERLGHYKIRGEIGKGGMGAVYRAEHVFLRRHVAVKVINPRLLDDETISGYFATEMLMMGSLQHPNIVQTTDAGDEDGRRYIVMELLDGWDLSKYVKAAGPLPVEVALGHLRQAATGLDAAHRTGIVHRDVKPSNLFVTTEGTLKLLDLGLAKCMCQKEDVHAEHFVGSPGFMAPEQIKDGISDVRSDLYSLGCTFYFMLTGHAPFESPRYPSVKSILDAQLTEDLPSLETYRDDLNPRAEMLIRRMTAKDPEERFQSMRELIAAIDSPKYYRERKTDRFSLRRVAQMSISAATILLVGFFFWFSSAGFSLFPCGEKAQACNRSRDFIPATTKKSGRCDEWNHSNDCQEKIQCLRDCLSCYDCSSDPPECLSNDGDTGCD